MFTSTCHMIQNSFFFIVLGHSGHGPISDSALTAQARQLRQIRTKGDSSKLQFWSSCKLGKDSCSPRTAEVFFNSVNIKLNSLELCLSILTPPAAFIYYEMQQFCSDEYQPPKVIVAEGKHAEINERSSGFSWKLS